MADTFTTNLNLTKPEVGASTDTWGTKINADSDTVDAIFAAGGTAVHVKFASANFDDNAKAIFGTGDDLEIYHDGSNNYIKGATSDQDIIFQGNDGGSNITALTLDMSAAGAATFNDKITAVGTSVFTNLDISGDIDVDGTTNLDVVDIDGAVDMATTLAVAGTATFAGLVDAAIIDGVNFKVNGGQGSDGQVLTSTGSGVAWEAVSGGATDINGLSDAKSGGTNFTSSIILGHQTTGTLSSANQNTAVGYGTIDAITSGDGNSALGYNSLGAITTGSFNVGMGYEAFDVVTSGSSNTAMGTQAGAGLTTGVESAYFGRLTTASSSGVNGETVIGYNITGKGNFTAFIGGSSGAYNEANSSTWSTTSDRRIKKNIVENNIGLEKINQIQVKNFEYKSKDEIEDLPAHTAINKQGQQLGVIAQEIQEILPEVVKEESTGCLTVNPDNLTWYLVNAVKELSAKCDSLQNEINILKGE